MGSPTEDPCDTRAESTHSNADNIDRLAAAGTRFEHAYCNSPLCVPSRFSFMSGRYVHDVNAWDNGSPFPTSVPTIGNYLEAAGYDTYLCGRTHFVGRQGFGNRLFDYFHGTKHLGYVPADRSPEFRRVGGNSHVSECGVSEHERFTAADEQLTELAVRFLENRCGAGKSKRAADPWLLYVGLFRPHFPLLCPRRYFDRYYPDRVEMPETRNESLDSQHSVVQAVRRYLCNEEPLPEETVRSALAAYYGLVTFTDEMIGKILDAVGDDEETVIMYTSDHGENGGHHGLWQKHCFYEHSVRVPLIVSGPNIRGGSTADAPVSLVDVLPTLLDIAEQREDPKLPGRSLLPLLTREDSGIFEQRPVFAEYHAWGMEHGGYMIRRGSLKLNWYVGYEPELFDLSIDQDEMHDVADDPSYRAARRELTEALLEICDPEYVDQCARANQERSGNGRYEVPLMYRGGAHRIGD